MSDAPKNQDTFLGGVFFVACILGTCLLIGKCTGTTYHGRGDRGGPDVIIIERR